MKFFFKIILILPFLAANYDDIIPKVNTIVVSMPGCSACKQLEPIVKELVDEGFAISIMEGRSSLEKYNVESCPTIIIMVNGKESKRHTGYLNKKDFIAFINNK